MRRPLFLLPALLLVVGLVWWLWPASQAPEELDLRESPSPIAQPSPQQAPVLPIPNTPCLVRGVVKGGRAARVSLHSIRGQIDLPAEVTGGGHAFQGQLPEQGRIEALVVAEDGRTAVAQGHCDGSGRVLLQVQLPPQRAAGTTLAGRCIYLETGVAVAEARVRGRWAEANLPAVFAAMTDDEGRFSIKTPPGVFEVSCAKDGDESRPLRVTLEHGADQSLELFLGARAAVAGTVRDAQGVLPGLTVQGRAAREDRRAKVLSTQTDAEGRYLLTGLPPGSVIIEVQDEGRFAEGHGRAKVDLPYTEIDLLLQPSLVTVEGFVKSEGEGLPGAEVRAHAVSARRGRGPRARIQRATRTDAEGHYVLGGLAPGPFRIEASAPQRARASTKVTLAEGSTRVDLKLDVSCQTELRVLPDSPSQPVWVRVQSKATGFTRVAGRTGAPILIEGSAGEAKLSVSSAGAEVMTSTATVRLCEGPLSISLQADPEKGALEVTTLQADGGPAGGVPVWINARGGRAVTGDDGKATFKGLKPRSYRVGTRDTEPVQVEVQAGRTAHIEISVRREVGGIQGVVQSSEGPVEGAAVLAACVDGGRPPSLDQARVRARSDGAGNFEFEPDDGGVCLVRAEHGRLGSSQPVLLRVGDGSARLELRTPAKVSGQVVHAASGQPVTSYTLSVSAQGAAGRLERRTLQMTDPDGRFSVQDIVPGAVTLSVDAAAGRANTQINLSPGEHRDGLELSIFSQGQVVGSVVDPDGAPIVGARVRVEAQRRPLGRSVTDAQGRFSFSVPAGDALQVYASAKGYYPLGTPSIELQAGGPTDVGAIELSPRGGPEEKEGGIGIMFSGDAEGIRVIRFTEDSPAREAGLLEGDLITAIDGVPFGANPLVNWVVTLRGLAGTSVVLEIQRGTRSPFVRTVVRRAIGLEAVPQRAP